MPQAVLAVANGPILHLRPLKMVVHVALCELARKFDAPYTDLEEVTLYLHSDVLVYYGTVLHKQKPCNMALPTCVLVWI